MGADALAARVARRYSADRVKALAASRHPCLGGLPRYEKWGGGHGLVVQVLESNKPRRWTLERRRDYQRVRFRATDSAERVLARCDSAIRELGSRMEECLTQGTRISRTLAGEAVTRGLDGLSHWEHRPCALYSCGPAPRLLDADGLVYMRRHPLDTDDEVEWDYEIVFGYYGNVGPISPWYEAIALTGTDGAPR